MIVGLRGQKLYELETPCPEYPGVTETDHALIKEKKLITDT